MDDDNWYHFRLVLNPNCPSLSLDCRSKQPCKLQNKNRRTLSQQPESSICIWHCYIHVHCMVNPTSTQDVVLYSSSRHGMRSYLCIV
jgi:hypothetical protein